MNKLAARLAAFALGTCLAVGALFGAGQLLPESGILQFLVLAKSTILPSAQARLDQQATRRNTEALAEIERLRDHPWAGVYRTAGPWPTELVLAPEAGFTLYDHSWCGNCDGWAQTGTIRSSEGLRLVVEVDGKSEIPPEAERPAAWYQLDERLDLVRWGDLLFAVPAWRMELFCAEACDGRSFPLVPFCYLGDPADFDPSEPPRPQGVPEVPAEFRPLLLQEPIVCRVSALLEQRVLSGDPGRSRFCEAVLSLDAGTDQGLRVGMRLFVAGASLSGRVEEVSPASARLRLLVVLEGDQRLEDLVGQGATTRRPGAAAAGP